MCNAYIPAHSPSNKPITLPLCDICQGVDVEHLKRQQNKLMTLVFGGKDLVMVGL